MPIITRKSADAHQLAIFLIFHPSWPNSNGIISSMAYFLTLLLLSLVVSPAGPKGNNKEKSERETTKTKREKQWAISSVCVLIAPSGWQEGKKKREIQSSPTTTTTTRLIFYFYFLVLGWYYSYGPSFPFWLIRRTAQVVCGLPLSKEKQKKFISPIFLFGWLAPELVGTWFAARTITTGRHPLVLHKKF